MEEAVKIDADVNTEPVIENRAYLPFSLPVELTVQDPDIIAELYTFPEGRQRDQFALKALRIGVLALKQARGEIDVERIRRESDRLLESLQQRLSEHSASVHDRLTASLQEYFDPQNGRFQDRLNRLIKQDGELEQLLRRQIGNSDSELCTTLAAHFGEESPLMKTLSPDQSKGLLAAIRDMLDVQLKGQRDHVLSQFSLDNKEGALSRFIVELTDHHGEISEQLQGKIDGLVKEFSLNEEGSALNRLVKNVEDAQKTITKEFSLNDEKSALTRLKRELTMILTEHRETNQKFQEEVKGSLRAMIARKEEADRSTRHGLEFEDAVCEAVQHEAQKVGDVASKTGDSTGLIKNCKIGDCLIELGPDSAAGGARIAVEAKENSGYDLAAACAEIEMARKNRGAQIGLFVFSKKTGPNGLEPLARYGQDVFVVWDAEDAATDLYLRVGLTLARALCVRHCEEGRKQAINFTEIDKAILEIEKRASALDDVETWTTTIQNNSEKILKKVRGTRKSLELQAVLLAENITAAKDSFSSGEQ